MITREQYQKAITNIMRDKRCKTSHFMFYTSFIALLDRLEVSVLAMTMREYEKEMTLSMGAISDSIPHLVKLGYLQGGLYPNARGHESWRLSLADTVPNATRTQRKQVALFRHQHGGMSITIQLEENSSI